MSTQPFAFLLMIILISLQLVNNIVTNERQLKYYSNNLEQLVESRTQELKVAIQKTTRLEERNRLAGELHDSVNQNLHSLVMIADSLPKLWQTRPEEILPALRKMNDIAQETLAKMRDMLVELYPQKLTEKPLGELLREMSQAIAHRTSLQVTTCIGSHSNLSPEVQICFYRIAQEAINNILRHARARQIEIHLNCQHLQCKSERLQLLIKDDGIGFSDKDVLPESLGFRLMADRVKNIGGYLKISSQPGQGTEVLIESPVVT